MKPSGLTVLQSEKNRVYSGPELRSHYILESEKIWGSAVIAFRGGCHVATDKLVDWEDRLNQDFIRAQEMVHFIGEFFGVSLAEGLWIQRLVVAEACSFLCALGHDVIRRGDDLYCMNRKLSVSIVTVSSVSALLHLGINIDPTGAPVPAIGLSELDVNVSDFTGYLLGKISEEWASIERALVKVRPVP